TRERRVARPVRAPVQAAPETGYVSRRGFPVVSPPNGAAMPSPRAQREACVHALAARQHALVTRRQAIAAGLTADAVARRVRAGLWVVAAPGVSRLAGAPRSWPQRALAAVLSAGPGAVASHRTAAHLWGLDGFAAPGRIDVTLPGPHGRRRR